MVRFAYLAYSLSRDLNPGERCSFSLKPNTKALDGSQLYGRNDFQFFAPGPWIENIQPYPNATIEEDQIFIVTSRRSVTKASVEAHVWGIDGKQQLVSTKFKATA